MLAANCRRERSLLAAILRSRSLVVVRCRLVLVFGLHVGLGAVPLWPVVQLSAIRLALGAGNRVVAVVGDMALLGRILRLGAVAARMRIPQRCRAHVVWSWR